MPDLGPVFADNRRVLQPHTERHSRLIAAGGTSLASPVFNLTVDTTAPDTDGWRVAASDPDAGWHTSRTGIRYRFLRYER